MKITVTIGCAALALSVALASVPSFAQNASDIAKDVTKDNNTNKVAQGPAGLNYGAGGGLDRPWIGPATGQNNPVSGSALDPGMRKPLVPGR